MLKNYYGSVPYSLKFNLKIIKLKLQSYALKNNFKYLEINVLNNIKFMSFREMASKYSVTKLV